LALQGRDLNKVIELDPKLALAYFMRGQINFLNRDYTTAIADLSRAETLGITELLLYEQRGKAKYLGKDYEAALADFARAETLAPKMGKSTT
jgi:tetratricopeptide (TPR) repeat protein